MSEGLKIDDWLDGERDALTDEIEAALAPRRSDPEAFGAGVRERIRRAEGAEGVEGGAEPLRMERLPEPAVAGGLGWAAGLLPPMLLSKGASKAVLGAGTAAASKAGTKLTLKAVPALAAMPIFTLLMIAATFVYAIRGQLGLSGDGAQRTDELEAASAVRAWWGRNLVPTLITAALLVTVFVLNPGGFFEHGLVLIVLASSVAAVAQLRGLSAEGLASREQVGKLMGGFLLFVFGFALQAQQFMDMAGSASSAGALERVAPFLVVPALSLSALLCLGLGKAAGGGSRKTVAWAVAIWVLAIGGLGSLWATLGHVEADAEDVRGWVSEATEEELSESGRWDAFGQALRMMDAAGEPLPDLSAFEAVVHEELAREGADLNPLYLLPLLRMDRALGTGFAADQALPEALRVELEEYSDRIEVPGRDRFDSDDHGLIGLLGFRELVRFDESVVARMLYRRQELAERMAPNPVHWTGPGSEDEVRKVGIEFWPEPFERTWRPLLVAETPDFAGIVAAGRSELAARILRDLPEPDRYGAVSDYLNAADALEFLEASERVPSLAYRVHRALLDTWVRTKGGRSGAFKGTVDADERDVDGVAWENSNFFGWVDTTASAVEAMARWGVPEAPADGSRPGIDLLALERYLVETAHTFMGEGCSSYSVRAVGALSVLRTLPEFRQQLEAHRASDGPLDVLGRMPLALSVLLLSFLALFATLRAPVEDRSGVEAMDGTSPAA
ncbi:MAG: hypothetical protein PVJ89_09035 [Planctomycetota bacterium]|jgi:hypothetical protein